MAESAELKSLLMKVKEENENVDLKLDIQKTKIMASVPSVHWKQIGKQRKQWLDFIFGGSKFTANGDWSHVIKDKAYNFKTELMTSLIESGNLSKGLKEVSHVHIW